MEARSLMELDGVAHDLNPTCIYRYVAHTIIWEYFPALTYIKD